MAQTNVQAFSGDVEISSNLAVSGSKFTYDNTNTTVFTGTTGAAANEIGYLDMSTSSTSNNIHVKIYIKLGVGAVGCVAEYSFYIRPNAANSSLIYDYRNQGGSITPVVYRTNANDLHSGGTAGVVRFGYSLADAQNVIWRAEVSQRNNNATFYPTNTGSAVVTTDLVQVTPAPFTSFNSNVAVGTNTLFVDSVGNKVGIGTNNPQAPFHVKPVNNSADTENTLLDFRGDFTAANQGYLGIFATETHTNAVGPDLRFKGAVYNGTASPTINQVMCLKPSGNVGIGTATPNYRLDLGDDSSNSRLGFGLNVALDNNRGIYWADDVNYAIYRDDGAWSSPNYAQLRIRFATGIVLDAGGGTYGRSYVGVNDRMAIGSSYYNSNTKPPDNGLLVQGNVAIGTNSDAGHTLNVNGRAFANHLQAYNYFYIYTNIGADAAWRTAFNIGTTAIGFFSVLSNNAGYGQPSAIWWYQYKAGGTSGYVSQISGSTTPTFRLSGQQIQSRGSGQQFVQVRSLPISD